MPVVFATQGRDKQTLRDFSKLLQNYKGNPAKVLTVFCDMSLAFLRVGRNTVTVFSLISTLQPGFNVEFGHHL